MRRVRLRRWEGAGEVLRYRKEVPGEASSGREVGRPDVDRLSGGMRTAAGGEPSAGGVGWSGGGGRGDGVGMTAGAAAGRTRLLHLQRARGRDHDGSDARAAMRKDLEESRLAVHAKGVERSSDACRQRAPITVVVEPLMQAVAATNDRIARLEIGQDELLVRVNEMTDHVAELTTRLVAAGAASNSSQAAVPEIVHVVGQLRQKLALTVAQAPTAAEREAAASTRRIGRCFA